MISALERENFVLAIAHFAAEKFDFIRRISPPDGPAPRAVTRHIRLSAAPDPRSRRVLAVSTNEQNTRGGAATGEAFQASLMLAAVTAKLVQKGLLSAKDVVELADSARLVLERHRATASGRLGAIDHARARIGALIAQYSPKPPK